MTEDQKKKCAQIIHTAALSAGIGNLVPLPGTGVMIDTSAVSVMTVLLSEVFDIKLTSDEAKKMAVNVLQVFATKWPVLYFGKELLKSIPLLGNLIGMPLSFAAIEAVGWHLAVDFAGRVTVA